MIYSYPNLFEEVLSLLMRLIQQPSFSREEDDTAQLIDDFLTQKGVMTHRHGNNIWAFNAHYDPNKPTILLNSHHDTVKPNAGYTRDPFEAKLVDGKLYGLGSNDAGGCLVSLIAAFCHFYELENLPYNLCLAATAEEEISGLQGIESILPLLGPLDCAIVGEPTRLQLAVAERGLLVLDVAVHGQSGHAARGEGINAIHKALPILHWFESYVFEKESTVFGPMKMNVTVIQAGSQHNVVPATCSFVVDIRLNDQYTHQEVLDIIRSHVHAEVNPRSMRLKPSFIELDHPLVRAGIALGGKPYGSPTTSDQALLSIPSLKYGPGDSARSHMADEYIFVDEIQDGVNHYIALLQQVMQLNDRNRII
jgi:acetylornithine deacetylase